MGKELSLEEAARRLNVLPEELKRMVERGVFRPVGRDTRGKPLFTEESLRRDLEAAQEDELIEDLLTLYYLGFFKGLGL